MVKRIRIIYSGTVQGVGFRYATKAVASSLGLTGWVRNRPDFTVEVVCEGEEARLLLFLDRIADGPMRKYITDSDISWLEPNGEFDSFDITF